MLISIRCAIRARFVVGMLAIFLLGSQAFAQAPIPPPYQSLYTELQTSMQGVEAGLSGGSTATTGFVYSAECLYANGNEGLALLRPTVRDSYLHELQALKSVGVTGVVFEIGFPILYQPFYQSIGQPQDYQLMVTFWQQVIQDVHSLGMKAIVETQSLFPGYYSSEAGFTLGGSNGYFATLSLEQFEAGRAAQAATIYSQIKPDYLDLGSEPDTEASNAGQPELLSPSTWAQAISSYVQAVPSGTHNPLLGAGVGNWRVSDGLQYVQAESTISGLDYIDLHGYPVVNEGSTNTFQFLLNLINAAHTAGKPVAMSEYWLLKISSKSLSSNNAQDPTTASLNAYSFFAPLDQEFLADMWKMANQEQFLYGSAFWSRYFWAYVTYVDPANGGPAPGQALDQAGSQAAGQALLADQVDATAQAVRTLTGATAPAVVVVSSADYSTEVAAGSLATIFGTNLAPSTASGYATTLGGASVNVTDDTGKTLSANLLFASPGQINFVVPTGLQFGTTTITVFGSSTQKGTVVLSLAAPGLFSENAGGSGVAAAQTVTVESNGTQVFGVAYNCSSGSCKPQPINLGDGSVYLVLYGTGVSGAGQSNVTATVNGQPAVVQYAGPQTQFVGLDQINVLIPSSLAGAGTVPVQITADGTISNIVQIQIQ